MFRADRKQFEDKTNILEVDNKGLVNYPYRLSLCVMPYLRTLTLTPTFSTSYDKPPLFDVTLEDADLMGEVELTTNLIIAASESDDHLSDKQIDELLGVDESA